MKAYRVRRIEEELQSFITSALDGGKVSISHFCRFTPWERNPVPIAQEADGSHSRLGHYGQKDTLLILQGFEPRNFQPVVQSLS
jgi:hypothetical protein